MNEDHERSSSGSEERSRMAEINLLKDELKSESFFSGKAGHWSLYIVVGILVLEALVFGGLIWYEGNLKNQTRTSSQEAAAVEFEVMAMDTERLEAISFQERLSNLKTLLDSKVFWSPLFAELEENTLSQVFFNTLQVSESENKLIVTGVATDYTDLAKLIRGLELSPNVLGILLNSSGRNESETPGYSFGLEINFDPKLLQK